MLRIFKTVSLIELIAVLAIIAVLARAALPIYNFLPENKFYHYASKISFLLDKIAGYANVNKAFPNVDKLKLPDPNTIYLNPEYLNELTEYLYINDWDAENGKIACGRRGVMYGQIFNNKFIKKYDKKNQNPLTFACILGHINGTIESQCFYQESMMYPENTDLAFLVSLSQAEQNAVEWFINNDLNANFTSKLGAWSAYVDANASCIAR